LRKKSLRNVGLIEEPQNEVKKISKTAEYRIWGTETPEGSKISDAE